ncbi:MAG: DoxX family membrane protein [Bacteroidales bacterium]|nr:DoxX family membrane protein [Bacteroidales bacterium]
MKSSFDVAQPCMRILAVALQVLVGVWFVLSAAGKLMGLDDFEIYLFSYGFVSLGGAMLLARLLIVVEFVLGLSLILGLAPRGMTLLILLVTLLFCCFLCYAAWIGRTDDCHCMGSLVSFSPTHSLLKNAVLIVLCLLLLRLPMWSWQPHWSVWLLLGGGLTIGVFSFSLPDNWMFGHSVEPFDVKMLSELHSADGLLSEIPVGEGRKVVVLAKSDCRFCRRTLQKLKAIADRHDLPESNFIVLMTPVPDSKPLADEAVPMLEGLRYEVPYGVSFRLGYGRWPVVVMMDGWSVCATYHYRNINEDEIVQFLSL